MFLDDLWNLRNELRKAKKQFNYQKPKVLENGNMVIDGKFLQNFGLVEAWKNYKHLPTDTINETYICTITPEEAEKIGF